VLTAYEKRALLDFLAELRGGVSHGDCEDDYDFGFEAGRDQAYSSLAETFAALLQRLAAGPLPRRPRQRP